ncbi:MAG: SH3 domain-containing protein [Chloroflexi bacterium]|nr:SH3 domain-containing protein [Chloroflexota bacterium]
MKSFVLIVCLMLALFASGIQAQTNLTYGSAADGSIIAAGDSTSFAFSGSSGDLIFARVINLTSTLNTVLSLVAADGSEVISTTSGSLTHRLSSGGDYQIVITGQNGTTGDFVLRLDARTGIRLPLALGQVTRAEFAVDAPPQMFNFAQNPDAPLFLTVSAEDPSFRFSTEVRDAQGQVIAYFNPQMRGAVLTVAAGSGGYDVLITASDPAVSGTVLLDLESEQAAATTVPTQQTTAAPGATPPATLAATPIAPPSDASVFCHISTNGSANIRSAPDANSPVIERLTRSKAVEVIGISVDGVWFAVRLPTQVGWVAKEVARQIEPCVDVPVLNP